MAEVTNERVSYIWYHLPYAQGLQYQTVWYYRQGYECRSVIGGAKIDEPL